MAKKNFDSFLSSVSKSPRLSPEEIEEMTREVHRKEIEQAPPKPVRPVPAPPAAKSITVSAEKGRRGRKPRMVLETERLIRVSVDLPESVLIELKGRVVREKTDMRSYVRKLVEKDLGMNG